MTLWRMGMVGLVVALFICCTAPDKSRQALEDLGFTAIDCGGYSWFGCGDDYTFATRCRATNPTGHRVEAIVCCGYFKGCSVKF